MVKEAKRHARLRAEGDALSSAKVRKLMDVVGVSAASCAKRVISRRCRSGGGVEIWGKKVKRNAMGRRDAGHESSSSVGVGSGRRRTAIELEDCRRPAVGRAWARLYRRMQCTWQLLTKSRH